MRWAEALPQWAVAAWGIGAASEPSQKCGGLEGGSPKTPCKAGNKPAPEARPDRKHDYATDQRVRHHGRWFYHGLNKVLLGF